MRYKSHESYLCNKAIAEDIKTELRIRIVEVFATYNIREKGESLCDSFGTVEELQAGFMYVTELNIEMLKKNLEVEKQKEDNRIWKEIFQKAFGSIETLTYNNSKLIAA